MIAFVVNERVVSRGHLSAGSHIAPHAFDGVKLSASVHYDGEETRSGRYLIRRCDHNGRIFATQAELDRFKVERGYIRPHWRREWCPHCRTLHRDKDGKPLGGARLFDCPSPAGEAYRAKLRAEIEESISEIRRERARWPEPTVPEPSRMRLGLEAFDSLCTATDGCTVKPAETCAHGHPSWLRRLGLL